MKIFTMVSDVEFYAESIDDALRLLAGHFNGLYLEGLEHASLFTGGEIEISEKRDNAGDRQEDH